MIKLVFYLCLTNINPDSGCDYAPVYIEETTSYEQCAERIKEIADSPLLDSLITEGPASYAGSWMAECIE